jgi:hypothetical protein
MTVDFMKQLLCVSCWPLQANCKRPRRKVPVNAARSGTGSPGIEQHDSCAFEVHAVSGHERQPVHEGSSGNQAITPSRSARGFGTQRCATQRHRKNAAFEVTGLLNVRTFGGSKSISEPSAVPNKATMSGRPG